ncbi:MAG: glycosyltransferase family 61 protein, partial [Candidatus Sulfotelmatobacter sp.]
ATSSRSSSEAGMSLVPLTSLFLRRVLRRPATLADVSARTWSLCAAEVTTVPPAIYLEADLDRVLGLNPDTSRELESRRITGGKVEHAATRVYAIARIHLLRGCLYAGPCKHQLLERRESSTREEEPRAEKSGALACTQYGNMFFGHWLLDDLSLHLAAERLDRPVVVARPAYRHEPGYRGLLNVEGHPCAAGVFEQLLVLEDYGQNSHRRRRHQELRARLRSRVPDGGADRVYIRRGVLGARQRRALANGGEVEQFLTSQRIKVIDPDGMSSAEIARELLGAKLVIGTEGSHLAHALYAMREGAVLCVLQPPDRFNNIFKDYTDCLDMRYAFVTGAPAEGGFSIDTDNLARALDRIGTTATL